jgi:thiol-disulfide isomerase/thioredoxin
MRFGANDVAVRGRAMKKSAVALIVTVLAGAAALTACALVIFHTSIVYSLRAWSGLIAAAFIAVGFIAKRPQSGVLAIALSATVGSALVPIGLSIAHVSGFSGYDAVIAAMSIAVPFLASLAGAFARTSLGAGLPAAVTAALGVVGLAVVVYLGPPVLMQWAHPPHVLAKSVEEFEFTRADGTPVTLPDFRGKVLVLSFWASWCPPCGQELQRLQRFARTMAGDPSVRFLAVNADGAPTLAAAVAAGRPFLAAHHIALETVYAQNAQAFDTFGILGFPTIVVVDASGKMRWRTAGLDPSMDYEGLLAHAIAVAKRPLSLQRAATSLVK